MGKLVATATRTPNNIYVLDKIEPEKCHLGKEDESWLWNRRIGHIHFDYLVKIYKNQAIWNMPEVTNPANMKHNLLSVSQMCDQGHELLFNSKRYGIRKQGSGKLVATSSRAPNNIYVLDKIESEKCHLGKEDESWL